MNLRYVAFLSVFAVGSTATLARADVPPPNACTMPGQPCWNACQDTGMCARDSGIAGVCKSTTCTRSGPIDAGPDSDGGIVIGTIPYPCNLCFLVTDGDGGPEDADASADDGDANPDGDADADDGDIDANDIDADAGRSDGASGNAGSSGTGGSGGSSGTGGNAGSSGTAGTGGAAGSAGAGAGDDSGCSCFIDTDRTSSRPVSLTLALASLGGLFWARRRSVRTEKKGERSS